MDTAVLTQIALGVVPPGLAGLAVFLAVWRRGGKAEGSTARAIAASLAAAAVYVACHAWLLGGLSFPPKSSADWLPAFAVIAFGVAAWPMGAGVLSSAMGWVVRAIGVAMIGWLSVKGVWGEWSMQERAVTLGGFVAAVLVSLRALEGAAAGRSGFFGAALVSLVATGACQVLVLGLSSLKLGQAAGFMGAMFGGAAIAALIRPGVSVARGVVVVPVLLAAAAVFQGVLFGDAKFPIVLALLLVASPVLAWVGGFGPVGRQAGFKGGAVRLALAALPIGAALVIAAATSASK